MCVNGNFKIALKSGTTDLLAQWFTINLTFVDGFLATQRRQNPSKIVGGGAVSVCSVSLFLSRGSSFLTVKP